MQLCELTGQQLRTDMIKPPETHLDCKGNGTGVNKKQARKRTQYTYINQNQQQNAQKAGPPCGEERTSENNHPGLFPLKLGWAILKPYIRRPGNEVKTNHSEKSWHKED